MNRLDKRIEEAQAALSRTMERRDILLNSLMRTQERLKDQVATLKRLQKRRRNFEAARDRFEGICEQERHLELNDPVDDLLPYRKEAKGTNHPGEPHEVHKIKLNQ